MVDIQVLSRSQLHPPTVLSQQLMEAIVLYPSTGMGHLISMVELGKLILTHYPSSFSITILITTPSFNTGSTSSYIRHVSSTTPSITFHHLPTISLTHDLESYPSMEAIIFDLFRLNNPHVHHALQTLSLSTPISALVIDFFCTPVLPIASHLKIPAYYFFTSGASCLVLFFYFPTLDKNTTKSFKDENTLVHIPSLPPVPSFDMIMPMLDRSSKDYSCFLDFSCNLPKSAGIIVNTFESLEPKFIKAISDGVCAPDITSTPPLYCIGPLIAASDTRHDCLKWLDSQPSQSVVFLCFGSLGLFSADQLKEIAVGLERSGHRFMWVVRSPPSSQDKTGRFLPPPEPDLESLLPDGFLDRTKERGLVVKSWAPQVAVLSHDSVGGFVTHCGWNSVLEAVSSGVPMVAWPLYAEQKFNRVVLVEEMKLALPITESEDGFVTAAELEKRVRELMEWEEGNSVRELAKAKRDEARMAMSEEGGTSRMALAKLVESWKLGGVQSHVN